MLKHRLQQWREKWDNAQGLARDSPRRNSPRCSPPRRNSPHQRERHPRSRSRRGRQSRNGTVTHRTLILSYLHLGCWPQVPRALSHRELKTTAGGRQRGQRAQKTVLRIFKSLRGEPCPPSIGLSESNLSDRDTMQLQKLVCFILYMCVHPSVSQT